MSEDNQELDFLRAVLTNASGDVPLAPRFRALFTLKNLGTEGNEEAINVIAQGFKDDSELLKHEIAYVLGQTKSPKASPILRAVLEDPKQQPMVRHEAAEALGALNDTESLELLEYYYKQDPLEVIRQTCELAIERIKWSQSEERKKELIADSIFTSIDPAPPLPSDQDKVESLRSQLNDQSLSLFHRYRAMFRLRDIGTRDAVLALASGFSDPSALFRHEIAYVFGQMSDPVSVPALIEVLQNSNEVGMVRHEAAEALGSIATDDVLPILNAFVQDSEQVVRESAVVALDMYEFERSAEMDYLANPTESQQAAA